MSTVAFLAGFQSQRREVWCEWFFNIFGRILVITKWLKYINLFYWYFSAILRRHFNMCHSLFIFLLPTVWSADQLLTSPHVLGSSQNYYCMAPFCRWYTFTAIFLASTSMYKKCDWEVASYRSPGCGSTDKVTIHLGTRTHAEAFK